MRVMKGETAGTLGRGKANKRDAVQVWSESRQGKKSGNRAWLIKQIEDRCGVKSG